MHNDLSSPAVSPSPVARLATRVPDASASGLIDIQSLHAPPLPWSLASPGPAPPAKPAPAPRWGLAAVTAALGASVAMVALAAMVQPHATAAIEDHPVVERQMSMQEAAAPPEHTVIMHDDASAADAPNDGDEPSSDSATVVASAASKPEVEAKPKTKSKSKTKSRSKSKSKSKTRSKSKSTTASKSSGASDSIPLECVLDPAKCNTSGKPKAPSTGSSSPALAPKLTTTQLKKALAKTKVAARRCGPEHGADAGARVQVKLSIVGATGQVGSAVALGDHATSSLGRCVATALGRTSFPRFTAPRMGTIYTVRM